MAKLKDLEKFMGYEFSSGCYTGDDYKSFQTKYINYLRSICKQNHWQLVNVGKNHYCFSAFIKSAENKCVYISIPDVRYFSNEWHDHILIRTAKNETDYRGGFNNYTSAELSQKVRRGLNESRIKGNFTGGYLLFGYKKSGDKKTGVKVEIDENQAAIVKRLFEEFVSGRLVKDLIGEFNEEGVLYRGKPLGKTTVYNMLRNEKYIGIYRFGDEVYTNIYPAIIPETLFNLARAKIEINQYGKHVEGVEYLLKRKITCGYCRKPVSSESGTSKSGAVMRYYKCSGKRKDKTCPNIPVRKELLEQIVIDATYEALATPELIENIADRIMSAHKKRMQGASCLNLLEDQLVAIDNSIANLIKAMEQGIISQATKDRLNSLEQEKSDIQNKIAIEKQKEQLIVQRDDIVKYLKSAIKKEPRLMIQLIIKEVVLYNDKIEIHFNYTEAKRPDDEKHRAFSFYSFEKKVLVDQHRLNKPPIEKNYEIILSI